jgi:hypothetical protein
MEHECPYGIIAAEFLLSVIGAIKEEAMGLSISNLVIAAMD